MDINLQKLTTNVNLHALQPNFLNLELHYVIASDENNFRFAGPFEEPQANEHKFYCYLSDKELTIPAGNVTIKESYVLDANPVYKILQQAEDFFPLIECLGENCVGKAIRKFSDQSIEGIRASLQQRYESAEMHLIKSPQYHHLLLILPAVEISISSTMVYFKQRMPVTNQHYKHLEEE